MGAVCLTHEAAPSIPNAGCQLAVPRAPCRFVQTLNIESSHLTLRFQVLESELAFINPKEISVNTFFEKLSIGGGLVTLGIHHGMALR